MSTDPKSAALSMIGSLPDDVTWEDLQYHLYVRQKIEAGLADDRAGRMIDSDEMLRRFEEHREKKNNK